MRNPEANRLIPFPRPDVVAETRGRHDDVAPFGGNGFVLAYLPPGLAVQHDPEFVEVRMDGGSGGVPGNPEIQTARLRPSSIRTSAQFAVLSWRFMTSP
jgi:hypothetical protein